MQNESSSTLRVRYQETDQMGVVHHGNYITWFEVARTDWLRELGTDYRQIEEMGLLLPVIQVHCEYKQSARYDDVLRIRARMVEYSGVKLTFAYDVYREDELLATGTTAHCWTNKNMRPTPLKKIWPELDQRIRERLGQLSTKTASQSESSASSF